MHPPELNDLVFVCANLYERQEFTDVEKVILAIIPNVRHPLGCYTFQILHVLSTAVATLGHPLPALVCP